MLGKYSTTEQHPQSHEPEYCHSWASVDLLQLSLEKAVSRSTLWEKVGLLKILNIQTKFYGAVDKSRLDLNLLGLHNSTEHQFTFI